MYQHISVFTFLNEPKNAKTKQKNIEETMAYLEKVPQIYPKVTSQTIAQTTMDTSKGTPPGAPVLLGDVVQILNFETQEDLDGYGPSEAHKGLIELTDPMMDKVTAIDFKV